MDSLKKLKSSITIANRNRGIALPKTQPTKSSSRQMFNHQDTQNYYQVETCPQVSQFNVDDNFLYTHKLQIDYGRLSEPNHWVKRVPIKDQLFQDEPQQTMRKSGFLQSKRNLQQTATKQKTQQIHHKSVQSLNRSTMVGQSYSKYNDRDPMNTSEKKQNPQSSNTKKNPKQKNQNKLKQVLAAKNIFSQNSKQYSLQTTQRNETNRQSGMGEKTQRRAQHCRIIRSYVGGSKMQIKIINYPDSSEYMKLCGYRS